MSPDIPVSTTDGMSPGITPSLTTGMPPSPPASGKRPGSRPFPGAFLRLCGRAAGTLLLLGPAAVFFCWLVLTCADFAGMIHSGRGLARPWGDFALRMSLGCLLPPAFLAAFNERGNSPSWLRRLLEAGRAALIAFACFVLLFFASVAAAGHFVSGMYAAMLPILLQRFGPLFMCFLLYLSYRMAAALMPPPQQDLPAPPAVRTFSLLALLLTLSVLVQALAPIGPFGLPELSASYYDVFALPQDLFLFAALARLVRRTGARMFRPAYIAICILGPGLLLLELPDYPAAWQMFHAGRAAVAVAACACLYAPSSRRWFV